MSDLVIPPPLPHSQSFDALTLRPRPLPRAQTRSAVEASRAPVLGRVFLVEAAAEEQPNGAPGGRNVNDGVPEAHQGEDDAGGVGEGEGNEGRVHKGIYSVDRRRDL